MLSIDKSVKPVQQPIRRIPISLEAQVEKKLEDALKLGIIEPVLGPSPWISPVVTVFKKNGELTCEGRNKPYSEKTIHFQYSTTL